MNSVASFIIGIVAGAAFGVLLAPAKGVETRRKIREEADKMIDEALSYNQRKEDSSEREEREALTKQYESGKFLD